MGCGLALAAAAICVPQAASAAPSISVTPIPAQYYSAPADVAPAIAPAPTGSNEWLVVYGASSATLLSASQSGTFSRVTTLPAAVPYSGALDTAGHMWLQPDGGDLLAVAPSGQLSDVGQSGVDQQDLTLGPDGALYVADSSGNAIDRCAVTSRPSATCTQIAVPAAFSDQSPAAISSAGGELFYATGDGELGSLTPAGVIGNPFADPSWSQVTLAASPRSMAGKAGGMLYAAAADASAAMGQNDALAAIDPLTGSVTAVFGPGNGMPAGASVGAVAAGPDGNIWFTDTYNTAIGELNLTSGRITEFPLPGDATFDTGSTALAAGPAGSAALFFPVLSASNKPELGEVSLAAVTGSQGSSGSTGSSGSAGSSGSGGTVGSSGSQAHGTAGGTRSSHSAKHKRIRHKRHRRHSRHGRR